jgi:phage gp36-like protein
VSYCATADLKDALSEEKLKQLTDDDSLGIVVEGRVTYAIAAADALIDSYIRGTHTVPLSPVTDRIKQVSIDLSVYFLYKRRREYEMPVDVVKDYDRQISFLRDVQSGKVLLDTPTAVPNTGGIFKSNRTSESRIFNDDVMAGF